MDTRDAYNNWALTYDSVTNKTRDLETTAIKSMLPEGKFQKVLEIGCGTGKNTYWLSQKCAQLTAVDFSAEMLAIARQKIHSPNIDFRQADILAPWPFEKVNLISCSLVLEHIKDIHFIFEQAARVLEHEGLFYICELHPYKQLQGSCARFEKDGATVQLEYFVHHIMDYFNSAIKTGFSCDALQEWFDTADKQSSPRLISFLFRKK